MKIFSIKMDYNAFFVPQSTTDAEKLMTIMSRGTIVKDDWQNKCMLKTDEIVAIRYIDLEKVLDEPIPAPPAEEKTDGA